MQDLFLPENSSNVRTVLFLAIASQFDAMRDCMKKNPEVFAHLLEDVNEAVGGAGGEVPSTSAAPQESAKGVTVEQSKT